MDTSTGFYRITTFKPQTEWTGDWAKQVAKIDFMYLGRVEGGAGGGGAHQTKLAVNPEAEILKLAAHAQAVRHRLLLDVEILNTRGCSNTPYVWTSYIL